jgi:hypothetical protein
VSDSDVAGSTPPDGLDDPEERARISDQLALLIPEVRKLRRSRWLTRGLAVVVAAQVVFGVAGAVVYHQNRQADAEQRADRRAALEQALRAECLSSADQTADLRKAFDVLVGVAVRPGDQRGETLAAQLNARLDEAVPPRDCAGEAAARSGGG